MDTIFTGEFIIDKEQMAKKLSSIKAFVFDWDGVFNLGDKDESGSSTFTEVDSMGTNLLRLNYYLRNGSVPRSAIITGENNKTAFGFAKREHFDAVYYNAKNKKLAVDHFCREFRLQPHQIAFVFDDVLDLNVAAIAGLRCMINRPATPMFKNYVIHNQLVDYITKYNGGEYGVREVADLLMGLYGSYSETLTHRMNYTDEYSAYIKLRNSQEVAVFGPEELK
jgi:3-deoxy-D-manno-octulosonate 8-phosphate phosphatase (KDO 8-P phosphatase)